MLSKLRDRIRRWLFGPPPRDEYTVRLDRGIWQAYRDGEWVASGLSKDTLEQWLDAKENEAR